MKTRVAINGFGRIGRMSFRIMLERKDIEVVGINDLTDTHTLAHLLKYDTNYGQLQHKVDSGEGYISVDGVKIPISAEKDPNLLPWGDLKVDVVIESTGRFVTTADASAHIKAGAKKVVISAPAKDEETKTLVIGANEDEIDQAGDVLSNASCTAGTFADRAGVSAARVCDSNTLSGRACVTSYCAFALAALSRSFMSSHCSLSPLACRRVRTNVHPPESFSPLNSNLSLPAL